MAILHRRRHHLGSNPFAGGAKSSCGPSQQGLSQEWPMKESALSFRHIVGHPHDQPVYDKAPSSKPFTTAGSQLFCMPLPPILIILHVICKLSANQAKLILIAPAWPRQCCSQTSLLCWLSLPYCFLSILTCSLRTTAALAILQSALCTLCRGCYMAE